MLTRDSTKLASATRMSEPHLYHAIQLADVGLGTASSQRLFPEPFLRVRTTPGRSALACTPSRSLPLPSWLRAMPTRKPGCTEHVRPWRTRALYVREYLSQLTVLTSAADRPPRQQRHRVQLPADQPESACLPDPAGVASIRPPI